MICPFPARGLCVQLSVVVHGSNFEEAKKNMEAALQSAVESVLRDRKMAA
jgi:hypothetical protein